jgi:hypothetical protein
VYVVDPKDSSEKGLIKYGREKGVADLRTPDGADHVYFMAAVEDAKGGL